MKDSPIYFSDERWEKLEAEVRDIQKLLLQVLEKLSDNSEPKEEILSAREAANLLCVDIGTVYAKCAKGSLPHFKIGKQFKFRRADVIAWLERAEVKDNIDVDQYVNQYLQKYRIKG